MRNWRVRVYCMTASYQLGVFVAESRDDAINQARRHLRSIGNADMCRWSFSAWIDSGGDCCCNE